MLRSFTRYNNRLNFSVSVCPKNYKKELEILASANISSNKDENNSQQNISKTNTEDSLKKLFENFSQKNKKYPTTGFRPILRKNTTNDNASSMKTSLRDSLKNPKTEVKLDPKKKLLLDKIPNNLHNLVSFLSEKLSRNVLVHNQGAPHLSNFMTNFQALNFVNWNEQGIKILKEDLSPEDLKNIVYYKDLYVPFPDHALISVIQIVPKSEMPIQKFNHEIKKNLLHSFGSEELLAKIQAHEEDLKKKAQKDKSALNFKLLKVNWECHVKDIIRKVRTADIALRKGEKVELVFGPEFYLSSAFFRTDHHPQIAEFTRSKFGSNAKIPNERTFLQDLYRLFENRGYNKRKDVGHRKHLATYLFHYLEETDAKYKMYGDYETLLVVSIHSADTALATHKTLYKNIEKDTAIQSIEKSHLKEKKSAEKTDAKTSNTTTSSPSDMYSIKIDD
ncbi:uncharacterized protein HGUI_03355 [Hanseniaspora guilliermondii]|uniref:Uncharacterized protein n=1 Tax=Hanseniaspora guilliermondii TaxID=56406 RepID=A0A1L0B7U6_9ASCO|nr:uncharacterized protein HGUI_03355 [Hanseniaspora guilliermondii]